MTRHVKRREFLGALGGIALAGAAGKVSFAAAPGRKDRLNVLFLMTDQQHHQTLSASGCSLISTPHLDRLAADGARFELATCVTPYCSPSRASIITGLYPHGHGIVRNVAPWAKQEGLKEGMFPATESLLAQRGYAAAHRGKWHLGDKGDFECYRSLGYHGMSPREYAKLLKSRLPKPRPAGEKPEAAYLGRPVEMIPAVAEGHRAYMQWPRRSRQPISIIGRTAVPAEWLPEGMVTDQVIRLIEQYAGGNFMVTASWSPPHALWVAPEPYYSLVPRDEIAVPRNLDRAPLWMAEQTGKKLGTLMGPEGIREYIGVYHGQVKMIDDYVGRILGKLDELGLADNTLVIFTSDHGDMLGQHGVIGKSVGAFWEGILRIPLLMRLPGRIPAGTVVRQPASQVDLMPTILDYAGLDVPARIHGRSLRPVLEGRADRWRDYSFCQRPGMRMIRTGRYKYTYRANGRHELFDLAGDPHENENCLTDPGMRQIVGAMHGRLRDVMRETDDPMLAGVPDRLPA